MANEYIKLWESYRSYFAPYSDEEVGRLVRAMLAYRFDGTPPDLSGNERFVWPPIQRDIDEGIRAQERRMEANRENGRMGGLAKASKSKQSLAKGSESKRNLANLAKVKDKDKDKDKVKDKDTGQGQNPPAPDGAEPPAHEKLEESPETKVQWAEFVTMTNAEHDSLVSTYGPVDTARLIEILDNYKGSSGKTYKSDFRAIKNWCVKRLREEKSEEVIANGGHAAPDSAGVSGRFSDLSLD